MPAPINRGKVGWVAMWDNYINGIIIEYYKEYYMPAEREIFKPDILGMRDYSKIIIGGDVGLKYILGEEITQLDDVIIFSNNMVSTAREIGTLFYERYKMPLVAVKTSVPGKEMSVVVANRVITMVYSASTAYRSPSEIAAKYWDIASGELVSATFKVVSPYLYFIDYLDKFNNLLEIGDRDKYGEVLRKLAPIVNIPNAPIKPVSVPKPVVNNRKMLKYIDGRVVVYGGAPDSQDLILISDMAAADEMNMLKACGAANIKSHSIQLPGVLLMEKVTARYGRLRISVYTVGYYKLVSYTRIRRNLELSLASPNWVLYILLIEDNTGLDLQFNKKLSFYRPLATRAYMNLQATAPSDAMVYGYYISMVDLKKKYINLQDRIYPYYPVLHSDTGDAPAEEEAPAPTSSASPIEDAESESAEDSEDAGEGAESDAGSDKSSKSAD